MSKTWSAQEEQDFNILLVKTVERFRCLYDTTVPEYLDKCKQDEAWAAIAKTVKGTERDCKERWRNIRGGFTRQLRLSTSQPPKKPYYLFNHMRFILPFTRPKPRRFRTMTSENEVEFAACEESNLSFGDDNAEHDKDNLKEEEEEDLEEDEETEQTPCKKARISHDSSPDEIDKIAAKYFKTKMSRVETLDPDLCFLKSLLPDVRLLTPSQKRRVKIGILQLIDDELNKNGN